MCDTRHSPSLGSAVMATPTEVAGQVIPAWRVMSVFFIFS